MIAIIPMKYHSERVKDKNFKALNGQPLFYYILNSLLAIDVISKVIVNTDSPLVESKVQDLFGQRVSVSMRPPEICGDFVSMNKIISHEIERNGPGDYLQTHTTNPFLKVATITEAIKAYRTAISQGYDSLFTVNTIKSRLYDSDYNAINHDPANLVRTQDLPPVYEENSNLYIFSDKSFNKNNARIGQRPFLFPMGKIEATDIDTQEDWDLACCLMQFSKTLSGKVV